VAILVIIAGIGVTYRIQMRVLQEKAPAKPPMLPAQIAGVRDELNLAHIEAGQKKWEITAHTVRQEKDSSQTHLEDVTLKIYNKTADKYDLVKSAKAEFDQNAKRLYSEGEVEITLGLPVEGQPERPPVTIRSSAVTFEMNTNRAYTDRPADFTFENGTGKSEGAFYDATARELHLYRHAEIDSRPPGQRAPPMKIEAGELVYKEAAATIWLTGWARLTRENTVVDADSSVVQLQEGVIHQVDAVKAHGVDEYPRRKLRYAADDLHVAYRDGDVEHITGRRNARLVSLSEGSETTMTSDVVDFDFETANNQSVLKKAVGTGHATIESRPVAAPDGKLPETHIITSEVIEVEMRPGGREIQLVETNAPGRLDFLPNQPTQRRRRLDAERMTMTYGPNNQLQSFRAVNARTETEPNAEERTRKQAPSTTRSQNLAAEFDPKNGQMQHMEQWGDFAYEAGDRKARANRATLDQDRNLMTLETAARVWDATGTTLADRIVLDQKSSDFSAAGHVSSSRQPDKNTSPSGMLSSDEPVQALADQMSAANHNRQLRYEGHVVMWQGADRITAQRVEIDRDKRLLTASGGVTTQFLEKRKANDESKTDTANAAPNFVVVKAAALAYTDEDRLAHYTGGILLTRPLLRVKADELRAILSPSQNHSQKDAQAQASEEQQSRLEKAYADGRVEIVQEAPDRTRTGTGEHAEYYTADERIVLRGGKPQMVDSKKGYTRGVELTYYTNDDRLLVSGDPKERVTSRLRRKQ
jgi:lipopolysaccharide export system protein LptA